MSLRRTMTLLLCLAVMGLAVPGPAAACTCSRWDDNRLFMNSELVVVGRLARDQTPKDEASFWIVVERREKGRDGARRLKVLLPVLNEWSDCGCGPRTPAADDPKTYRFYLKRSADRPDAYDLLDSRRR
jgi:hypothetical protein